MEKDRHLQEIEEEIRMHLLVMYYNSWHTKLPRDAISRALVISPIDGCYGIPCAHAFAIEGTPVRGMILFLHGPEHDGSIHYWTGSNWRSLSWAKKYAPLKELLSEWKKEKEKNAII